MGAVESTPAKGAAAPANGSSQAQAAKPAAASASDGAAAGKMHLNTPMPKCLVVCGPSGVGKGTLINLLTDEFPSMFGFSVSHTTRKPREGEKNGVHYHFADKESMEKDIHDGKFLESANVHGNYYGTSTASVVDVVSKGRCCVLDIDVQGARAVRAAKLDAVFVFILPPSIAQLEQRLRSRGTEKEEAIQKRMANASGEIDAAAEPGLFNHVICNNDLADSYEKFKLVAVEASKGKLVPGMLESMARECSGVKVAATPAAAPAPVAVPAAAVASPLAAPAPAVAAGLPGMAAWRGRVAVVTGASSGIGREVAAELARHGMRVVAVARRVERLDKLRADLAAAGVPADDILPAQVDITKEDQVQGIPSLVKARWGPRAGIDALVNCASVGRSNGSLMDGDSMSWLEMLDTNVLGLCMCTREAARDMRARSAPGHIIHLSSLSAHRIPGEAATFHAATKGMVKSLCEGLRLEARASGLPIRVSSISPGLTESEVAVVGAGGASAFLQSEDVVSAVLFALAAPQHMEVNDIVIRPTQQKH